MTGYIVPSGKLTAARMASAITETGKRMLTMKMIDPKAKSNLLYVSQEAFDEMQQIPTVDAELVVRCKDCKHYKFGKHFTDIKFCQRLPYYAEKGGLNTADNDFCSYGERRGAR